MAITREALLSATSRPTQRVAIPEMGDGEFAVVQGMNARERTQFEKKFITEHRGRQKRNLDAFREQLCVFCLVEPRLSEADLEALSLVRADVIERIANVAAELSGISERDADELGKPSLETAATSTSSSASPANSASPSA